MSTENSSSNECELLNLNEIMKMEQLKDMIFEVK
jgi:hypothetical protein